MGTTSLIPGVMAGVNLAFMPRTALTKFLHQEYNTTIEDLFQGIGSPHNWRGRSHSYYGSRHRKHYSRSQSHPHLHHDRSHNFRRDTLHSSSSHQSSPCHPSASGCSPVITTGKVTPHSTFAISPTGATHSTDQSHSHCSRSHHAAQDSHPRKIKQCPGTSTPRKPHCPKTVTIQDSPSDSSSDSDSDSDPLN